MAQHIHVVLTEEIQHVGKSGELIKVRPGYARNYLIPRGLAMGATADNVARIEHQKKMAAAKAAKNRSEAEVLAKKLSEIKLTMKVPVGEGGKLYGAVTTRDIEEALSGQGYEVNRRRISCDPIKALGEYTATVRLGPSIQASIALVVIAK